jgi:hypothetical protein
VLSCTNKDTLSLLVDAFKNIDRKKKLLWYFAHLSNWKMAAAHLIDHAPVIDHKILAHGEIALQQSNND